MRPSLAFLLPLPLLLPVLAGCQRAEPQPPAVQATAGAPSDLERAALAAGVIADPSKMTPTGLFQRSHEAGRDSLCLVDEGDNRYRFGLEAIFGKEQYCSGRGTARRAGDKLVLNFSEKSNCIIVANYDGDRIALPGVIDLKCSSLCSDRGSLEGVSLPRLTNDEAAAMVVRNRKGEPLCGE